MQPLIAKIYGFYELVQQPVRPTTASFVIKVSTTGDVKHVALGYDSR